MGLGREPLLIVRVPFSSFPSSRVKSKLKFPARLPANLATMSTMQNTRRANDEHYGTLLRPPTATIAEYDDDAAVTEFICRYLEHLLTAAEARAGLFIKPMDRDTALQVKGIDYANWLDQKYGITDMAALSHELRHGKAALFRRVRERVLQHDATAIARCPACKRVLRTPRARQCLWCKHDWHRG